MTTNHPAGLLDTITNAIDEHISWYIGDAYQCKCGAVLGPWGLLPKVRTDHQAAMVADAITAYQQPRTITTAEELDALPEGSVVLDCYKDAWQKCDDRWCRPLAAGDYSSGALACEGPLTVIHEGGSDE